jgi:integrase
MTEGSLERRIFIETVAAVPPDHFAAEDAVLLAEYVRVAALARRASEELAVSATAGDRPSPWPEVHSQAVRSLDRLAVRLRLGRPRHVRKTAEHPLGVIADYQPKKGRRTGGNVVNVPIHPTLAAAIAATPMIGTEAFVVTDYGKPFTPKGLSNKMREWCDEAVVPPITDATGKSKNVASHGLRKLCLTRLAECGCNVFQIAAISGHKDLREVQIYVDSFNRKRAAAEAISKLVAAQSRNTVCLTGKNN